MRKLIKQIINFSELREGYIVTKYYISKNTRITRISYLFSTFSSKPTEKISMKINLKTLIKEIGETELKKIIIKNSNKVI